MVDGASLLPIVMLLFVAALWGWGLADVLRTDERDVRTYPRQTWLVIVAFGSVIGALYWFATGRPAARLRDDDEDDGPRLPRTLPPRAAPSQAGDVRCRSSDPPLKEHHDA